MSKKIEKKILNYIIKVKFKIKKKLGIKILHFYLFCDLITENVYIWTM